MRVPVKLLGFVFWVFYFNCARCQVCSRASISHTNTEPAENETYNDGDTVRLSCTTGFTGMYRLKCEKGEWKTSIARPCAKKKCSHPGDTANGDFKLKDGSEFVFGATVVYTCNKGFEMTSRINQRTCRSQGWDNTLPICEAVICPPIRTDVDMTASGNTEEGSYGDVIHFECVSNDKKIDGSSDIHCNETGDWSHSVPKCKEITCTAPDISNGYVVEKMPEYQKDAILKYRCSQGFKPREGIPKCAKFGWTLNPECDEVTCELKSTSFGVKEIKPEGKTIFRAGERVEITCAETYWVLFTKENIKSFTCGGNGKWDYQPVCAEIKCEVPRDQNVYDPYSYFRGGEKLGARKSYSCISGYDQMSAVATCTRDGWTPKPLCAVMCAAPNIPNAEIVEDQRTKYIINSRIQYKCNPGFEPEQPVHITCISQTQWTGIQQCTAKQKSCRDLSVEKKLIYSHLSNKKEVFYSCNTGYKPFTGNWWDSVTCSSGSWSEEPLCIREEECGAFPSVHHGKLKQTKKTFRDGDTTALECDPGFISTQPFITCVNGTWEKPVCEVGVHCKIPLKVENALITSKPEELYVDGSSVTYKCRRSFSMNGKNRVSCRNGTWEETPTCEEVTCELKSTTLGVKKIKPKGKTIFRAGQSVEITCTEKYWFVFTKENIKSFTCGENGQWDYQPVCAEVTCELKANTFGVKKIKPKGKTVFRAGQSVEITCAETYWILQTKENFKSFTCGENGQWDYEPVCEEIRCETPHDPLVSSPELYFSGDMKLGAKKDYYCKPGYDQKSAQATCTPDGWTPNPLCEIRCEVPRDPLVYDPYSYFRGNLKLGENRSYSCRSGYDQMSAEATCTPDGWTPKPLCAVMCAAPNITNAEIVGDQRTQYIINSRIQYKCNPGFEPEQPVHITCISQTEWTGIQQCTEIRCEDPRDPRVFRPDIYFKGDMKLGAKKDYYCISGYDQKSAQATCTRDGWTPNPLCGQ